MRILLACIVYLPLFLMPEAVLEPEPTPFPTATWTVTAMPTATPTPTPIPTSTPMGADPDYELAWDPWENAITTAYAIAVLGRDCWWSALPFCECEIRSNMRPISFFVEGQPIPKARPRVGWRRALTPSTTVAWQDTIGWTFRLRFPGRKPIPRDVPVSILVSAYFPVSSWRSIRGDLDNYLKAIMDALNGLAWEDDKQVVRACISKSICGKEHQAGVLITMRERSE